VKYFKVRILEIKHYSDNNGTTLLIIYVVYRVVYNSVYYRGADKSLARPGRKQANVSVRMV